MRSTQFGGSAPLSRRFADGVLIFTTVSAAGWCFEKIGRLLLYRDVADRGFLSMPLCPIYGTCVLLIGLTLGSPNAPSPLLSRLLDKQKKLPQWVQLLWRTVLYFLVATVLSTAVELGVGLIFRAFGIPLWDYSGRPGNLWGVICPSFSLLWGFLITTLMSLCWVPLCHLTERIPLRVARPLATVLVALILLDFCANCLFVLLYGERFLIL